MPHRDAVRIAGNACLATAHALLSTLACPCIAAEESERSQVVSSDAGSHANARSWQLCNAPDSTPLT